MNILFIGPYRQTDNIGSISRNYIHCLSMSGHNLSISPIYISNNKGYDISDNLKELENIFFDKIDVVIQHTIPQLFEKTYAYSIGICSVETNNIKDAQYIDKINLLDEIWAISSQEKKILKQAGVIKSINVVPPPVNIDRLRLQNAMSSPLNIPGTQESYNFYISSEFSEQSNIQAAIIAFNREFKTENVNLIINSTLSNISNPIENQKKISESIVNIKNKLQLYNNLSYYANEILITHKMSEEELFGLHKLCDCMLITSRYDSYITEALNALFVGNNIICTSNINLCELIKTESENFVDSVETPILDNNPYSSSGWQTCMDIDILDLQKKMRTCYNKGKSKNNTKKDFIEQEYSYKNIGDRIKCLLSKT